MDGDESDDSNEIQAKFEEPPQKKRAPKRIKIPRREKSVVVPPERVIVFTAGIKPKPVKLRQCMVSPLTLYELCADVVDKLDFPEAFEWNEIQVADWMEEVVGLPQYKECIIDNYINGRRLLRLEDPSVLPEINIHDFEHIKKITTAVRKLFLTDYVMFARSIGLPFRKPLTYCTWFKSRTGPNWGIRQNWTRSDVLRWMKILLPKPVHRDHWDLVWYMTPDFPKQMVARIPKIEPEKLQAIPHYVPDEEPCNEYLTPRKFILISNIPPEDQFIWMEHLPGSPSRKEMKKKEKKEKEKSAASKREAAILRLLPKKVKLEGLAGKDLILARRRMPKPKFLPSRH